MAGNATNELNLVGAIGYGASSETEVLRALSEMGSIDELTVWLSSGGGSAFHGLGIYNALKAFPAKVTIRIASLAASAASIVAMAGDYVVMETGASIMIHRASFFAEGNIHTMRETAELLANVDDAMAAVYAERSNNRIGKGNAKAWLAAMDKTTWFDGQSAVKAGLADSVVGSDAKAELPTKEDIQGLDPLVAQTIPHPPVDATEFMKLLEQLPGNAKPEPVVPVATSDAVPVFSVPIIPKPAPSLIPPLFRK